VLLAKDHAKVRAAAPEAVPVAAEPALAK
jgi:hypothetical protein